MRTTLSLDEDVAAELRANLKSGDRSFKELVNEALRAGLRVMARPPESQVVYHTRVASLGRCRLANLDDVSEALSLAEGENYR